MARRVYEAWKGSNVLILLFLTSARDPGIVPRNSHPPEEELCYDTTVSSDGRQTPIVQIPRTKEVMVYGVPVRVKYCDTCMLYRPPRCSHCSIATTVLSVSIIISLGLANALEW
ncbi:unnamed protein product [Microthlaspi erraticum]|uniref:protein S-acyltransferase n=1 Tax=Microthlaspi erraticum TaxID=1685480 RepID=A0A6D2I043_9BRAS|nr:unnamed protein product [Microthlaspi erraticum]